MERSGENADESLGAAMRRTGPWEIGCAKRNVLCLYRNDLGLVCLGVFRTRTGVLVFDG
jgi:hypothetical protein